MKSNFETEIHQQPEVLERFFHSNNEHIARLAERIRQKPPRFFLITARGTSDNAAIYAKYLFGALNAMPVALAMPSLYTLYDQPPDMSAAWVIGISQSGQSPDIQAVLEGARKQGAPTLAITNQPDSPIARLADEVINLDAGEEKSVAASKTYTAQLMAIAMLSAHLRSDSAMLAELAQAGDYARLVLNQAPAVTAIARRFAAQEQMIVVSRGFNYCTAFEIALKIKELAYMLALAYSSADFRHGPIALLEPGFPLLAIAAKGKALPAMRELISEVSRLGVDLALISNDDELLARHPASIRLPAGMPEWLSPLIAVIPGQLLALNLALQKGYDPDAPRGLRKVTLTY